MNVPDFISSIEVCSYKEFKYYIHTHIKYLHTVEKVQISR